MGLGGLVAAASNPEGLPWAICSAICVSAKNSSADASRLQASRTARMTAPAAAADEPNPRSWGKSLVVTISKGCSRCPENSRAASKARTMQAKPGPLLLIGPE